MQTFPLLDTINDPTDIRKLDIEALLRLSKELRRYIIKVVAAKEGHLGASLGVVELTIAIHYIFNTPNDSLVWDVGHQAYGHKILTGRRGDFHTNRQLNGLSGFPKRTESLYDTFGTGHSSTSISAALGMALAGRIKGDVDKKHIAVIGDASIANGMAFEALNHAGVSSANILVILNDNDIGIDPSVGAFKNHLKRIKQNKNLVRNNIIKALNFDYRGPVDGHDLPLLLEELNNLKCENGPQFLHVITTKGKGLKKAEENQIKYHAPGKFNQYTGELISRSEKHLPPKFQDVFGLTITELAIKNEKIVGITAAMPTGSSLKFMMKQFPDRTFDVGIAEQHAVTLAAGMATQNLQPVCVIYSTFLQRAYDQIIHDVALQNLPVIFCIDRGGLVGEDGATHHGVFDLAYLRCIPNLILCSPRNEIALRNILYTAQKGLNAPIAIRYPRGRGNLTNWKKPFETIVIGKAERLKAGNKIAVISLGKMALHVTEAIEITTKSEDIAHYDLRFLFPLDEQLLHDIFKRFEIIFTVEDGILKGGMGSAISEFASKYQYSNVIKSLGVPHSFIEHGSVKELYEQVQIDALSIAHQLNKFL